jgi:hypothetical protein
MSPKGDEGKRVLERVNGDPQMSRSVVMGYANKMRHVYGDAATADTLVKIAAKRTDPVVEPSFFCYECGGAFCEHTPDQGHFEVVDPESEE